MTDKQLAVLIVDDEPLARRGLARLVAGSPGFELAAECGNGRDAVQALREGHFDLILLDVEMPELDGLSVLAEVGAEAMPPVIFITAYDQYAVAAFEAHALDYLVKPVDPERFALALERASAAVHAATAEERLGALLGELDEGSQRPARLAARSGGRTALIPMDEIDWIQAADNYVRLHVGDQVILHRETLAHLAARLDPARFARVHRSHVINIDRVRELRPRARGDGLLTLDDGTELAVSRVYRAEFDRALGL